MKQRGINEVVVVTFRFKRKFHTNFKMIAAMRGMSENELVLHAIRQTILAENKIDIDQTLELKNGAASK